jgi:hypothetical protein
VRAPNHTYQPLSQIPSIVQKESQNNALAGYLNDVGLVEYTLTDGLELFHVSQQLARHVAVSVHDPEGRDVDVVVLEVFQLERFQIL